MISENLFSANALEYLNEAKEIAKSEGDTRVDTDHLLVALLSREDSPLSKFLEKKGISRTEFLSKVKEHLSKLKEQIDKAVQQEANHLIELRSQIMAVKSDLGSVRGELERLERTKRRIQEEIDRAMRYGDYWSVESLRLELRQVENLEESYKRQVESVKRNLSSIFKEEDVVAFIENRLSIDALIRKAMENS
ncbi:MAG TPA: ATP-dependent Clp protease ATP-binding subunit, partial [Aquificaceae bacterium]|nr:ATP-dependent Clp protease ATP-binding subunit [Aquificaceae bacterium]